MHKSYMVIWFPEFNMQIGKTDLVLTGGAAGLFKVVLSVLHQVIPPTIKVTQANEKLELAHSPFYLNTLTRPWFTPPKHPRRASVSSFGFGGVNFHVTVEEYLGRSRAKKLPDYGAQLFLFSAQSRDDLSLALTQIKIGDHYHLASLVALSKQTQQLNHIGNPYRIAILSKDKEDLKNKLLKAKQYLEKEPAQQDKLYIDSDLIIGMHQKPGLVSFIYPRLDSAYFYMAREMNLQVTLIKIRCLLMGIIVWHLFVRTLTSINRRNIKLKSY